MRVSGCRGITKLVCLCPSQCGKRKLPQLTWDADWPQGPEAAIPSELKETWKPEQKQNSGHSQNMGTGTPLTWRLKHFSLKSRHLKEGPWRQSPAHALLHCLQRAVLGNKKYRFSKYKLNVHHWKTTCFPKETQLLVFLVMLLLYKIHLRKLIQLKIPANGQICYSMNGNIDILRNSYLLMGWGTYSVATGLFFKKKNDFLLWKAVYSQMNITSVGCLWLFRGWPLGVGEEDEMSLERWNPDAKFRSGHFSGSYEEGVVWPNHSLPPALRLPKRGCAQSYWRPLLGWRRSQLSIKLQDGVCTQGLIFAPAPHTMVPRCKTNEENGSRICRARFLPHHPPFQIWEENGKRRKEIRTQPMVNTVTKNYLRRQINSAPSMSRCCLHNSAFILPLGRIRNKEGNP